MSDSPAAIGEHLRAAREAQGLALEQVAARLRLMNRQVAAMENGDFAALGQAVFARGFVRNYAKLLALDADAIVAQMNDHIVIPESPAKSELRPLKAAKRWRSAWLWGGGALGLLVIVLPAALYAWLTSGDRPDAASPAGGAAIATRSTLLKAPPEPARALGAAAPQAPAAMSGAAPAPRAAGAAPGGAAGVTLRVAGNVWIDIRNAQGKPLAHGLYRAGQDIQVKDGFPLSFVIGNAPQVSMSYAGQPFDLQRYTAVNVARFRLAADGAATAVKP